MKKYVENGIYKIYERGHVVEFGLFKNQSIVKTLNNGIFFFKMNFIHQTLIIEKCLIWMI
jgi:hypothetical protein